MTGHIPKDYKVANLTPIIQEGQKDAVSNYSLTPVVGKILESIWGGLGSEQLEKCNLIRDGQCGGLRWVLTAWGVFPGIAARGWGWDDVNLHFWSANLGCSSRVSPGWAAEPIGTSFNEGDDGCSLPGRRGGWKPDLVWRSEMKGLWVFLCLTSWKSWKTITQGKRENWASWTPMPSSGSWGRVSKWAFLSVSVQFRCSLKVMHRSGQCYCASGSLPVHTNPLFFFFFVSHLENILSVALFNCRLQAAVLGMSLRVPPFLGLWIWTGLISLLFVPPETFSVTGKGCLGHCPAT